MWTLAKDNSNHNKSNKDQTKKQSTKILIAAPIHQDPDTLKEYLNSLANLDMSGLDISYFFIDDNSDNEAKDLLRNFAVFIPNVTVLASNNIFARGDNSYTHNWSGNVIVKVTKFRNDILAYARDNAFDYLFMVDSDILLVPDTLQCLVKAKKDIISEIFWTKWTPDSS